MTTLKAMMAMLSSHESCAHVQRGPSSQGPSCDILHLAHVYEADCAFVPAVAAAWAGRRAQEDAHVVARPLASYACVHNLHALYNPHAPDGDACRLTAAPLRMQRQRVELGGEPPRQAGGGRARACRAPGQLCLQSWHAHALQSTQSPQASVILPVGSQRPSAHAAAVG